MLRILIMLVSLALLALPFLPIPLPFTLCGFNFPEERRHKNILYVAIALVLALATVILMPVILDLADWVAGLELVKWVIDLVPTYAAYSATVFKAVFANLLYCALVLTVKAFGGTLFGLFRKEPTPQQQQALEEKKAARKEAWKNFRANILGFFTGLFKKKESEVEDPKTEEEPKRQPLPEHLIPAPEKPDHSGRITLPGKEEKRKQKKTAPHQERTTELPETIPGEEDNSNAAFRGIAELFYTKAQDGCWYVQPQAKKVSQVLGAFLVMAGVLYLGIFTLLMIPIFFPVELFAKAFYDTMTALAANCYLYPCISLVVLTEIFWFMNGRLPDEPVHQADAETIRRRGRIVDLDKVEQDLMKTYGKSNQVKSFHSEDVQSIDQSRPPVDLSQEPLLQSVAHFAESQGLVRNDDYLRGILALTRGSDVLFDAPLYTAAGTYLYPYLSMRISQGDRIVVVCQDENEIPAVVENLEQGFRRVLRTHECLWKVDTRADLREDNQTDVLVLTPTDFQDDNLYDEGKEFFPGVTLVMLPDADRVITANNYYCLVMAERMKQKTGKAPQYLFLSTRHTLNLAGSLTQYFMLDQSIHTVHAEYAYGSVQMYVWKARNDGAAMLDNSAQAIPLEVGISKIAHAGGIPNINLVSGSAIFPNQVNPQWLDMYDAEERPIGFAVVADDGYNLPGVIYTYSRYMGKEASILHVISRPYMLRDYFFDRAARSIHEQPLMERGMAEHALVQRSGMILLLCKLMQGVPLEEFAAEMHRLTGCEIPEEFTFTSLKTLVDNCVQIAFGPNIREHAGFTVREDMDNRFRRVRKIWIVEEGILNRLLADTSLVTVRFTGGRPDVRIGLFRKMLDQRYLVGQNLIYDHRNYEVRRIDRVNGIITVDDANSVHNVPDDYIQVRHYTLGSCEAFRKGCQAIDDGSGLDSDTVSGSRLEFQGSEGIQSLTMVRSKEAMEIHSDTVAYYPVHGHAERMDLTDSTVVAVKPSQQLREQLRRKVGNALYLKLEGDFVRSDRLTMTLAIALQEMMKTLFPDQYFCLAVCPILEDPEAMYNNRDRHSRRIAGMYPRVLNWGQPQANAMELLIVDDCVGGTGVLDMLYSPEGIYLRNVLDMLSDYLNWLRTHSEGAYLYFGAKECPGLYDLTTLRNLLQVFSRRYIREHDLLQSLQLSNCCSFCGSNLTADDSFLWDNRLQICGACQDAYKPTEQEAAKILDHIRWFLSDGFGVTLPEELSVVLAPGKEISALDMEQKKILLAPELPLVTVHSELLKQTVRMWQLEHLRMTGEPEFEGQVLYVLLQYLQQLKQHQLRRRLHRRALLGTEQSDLGYCSLRQALQALNTENSFRYMLQTYPKGSKPPIRKTTGGRSTRVDPEKIRYSFYEELSGPEQQAYDLLLEGFRAFTEEIAFNGITINQEQATRVWNAVFGDHPDLLWVDRYSWDYLSGSTREHITGVVPVYCMDGPEQQKRMAEVEEETDRLLARVTPDMGDFDVALLMYELLAEEMDYDSLALDRQKRRWKELEKRNIQDTTPDDLRSIYGALVQKKAVCAGYAVAYQHLMQKLGIECIYVRGNCTEGGSHAWNIVKLEGEYYHVDVTWGDGSNTDATKHREKMCYNYFGLTDAEIRLSRTISEIPPAPVCTATTCNYFVRKGLFYEAYDHESVKQQLLAMLEDPQTTRLDLRFANANVRGAAERHLIYGGGINEILRASGRSGLRDWTYDEDLNIVTFFFEEG
ncbi:MAG: hypothetical protein IKC09_01310 [Oscillospiraceae bacterium]|nr:hypothetical protein [Oscillospiraceae bacterium]